MHWIVLSPFHQPGSSLPTPGSADGWILEHIPSTAHSFTIIPASYSHDRSRPATSARQWLDYARQAFEGWRAAKHLRGQPIGFITVFPQLAVMTGLIRRLTFGHYPVLAWCFNLGHTYGGLKGHLARLALRGINLFAVHSKQEAATYAQWLGMDRSRIVFVPLSVAETAASGLPDNDEPFILALGTANRDYSLLFAALARGDWPAVVVCGHHALAGLEIPACVTVHSGLSAEECRDLSLRARINVIPLKDTTTAAGQVTVIEAMMAGKAVIATKAAGTVDYVVDGVNGVLLGPGDAAALREAIGQLWNDAACRAQLGAAAGLTARASFTFRQAATHMHRLLDQLEALSAGHFNHSQMQGKEGLPPTPGPLKP